MLREQLRAEEERRYVDEEERNPQKVRGEPFALRVESLRSCTGTLGLSCIW